MAAPIVSEPSTDKAVEALKTACDEAYAKHSTSCSHAVWYVVAKVVDPSFEWRDANHMIDFLVASPDWKEADLAEGARLAQKGVVVIGGLKSAGAHGHVIVLYPAANKPSGGYLYSRKDKKTGKTIKEVLRSHGDYPRALSTSNGSWPGAKSNGDKTVWDPWASDDVFAAVKFWTKK